MQTLPYPRGIFLVVGLIVLIANIHTRATPPQQPYTVTATVFTAVFALLLAACLALAVFRRPDGQSMAAGGLRTEAIAPAHGPR